MTAEEPSLEELKRQYRIAERPFPVLRLGRGMVFRIEGRLRVVVAIHLERAAAQPVVIETLCGVERLAGDARLKVWHAKGKPFLLQLPEEEIPFPIPPVAGGSAPPAQDAAGIVPVWLIPKRLV